MEPERQHADERHPEDIDERKRAEERQADPRERPEEPRLGHHALYPSPEERQDGASSLERLRAGCRATTERRLVRAQGLG